jgi:nucleotide-binding universal stress UspA family protein
MSPHEAPAARATTGGLRSLLVQVDSSPACDQRLALAAALAHGERAALHGVFAETVEVDDLPYAHVAGLGAAAAMQDAALMRRAQARAAFEQATQGLRTPLHWTELNGDQPARTLARHAQCADLVVLGAPPDALHGGRGVRLEFIESVLLASGRPALLVPARHHGPLLSDTAVVAWKPSPECARALSGALPLLRSMRRVVVASWGEEPLPTGGLADVQGWLQQHGVATEMQRHRNTPHDLPAALATLCRHEKAGLLVMGCYSHTRLRERVLGGATRAMLQALPLPVLMAH